MKRPVYMFAELTDKLSHRHLQGTLIICIQYLLLTWCFTLYKIKLPSNNVEHIPNVMTIHNCSRVKWVAPVAICQSFVLY
jgi:hypothetical protein